MRTKPNQHPLVPRYQDALIHFPEVAADVSGRTSLSAGLDPCLRGGPGSWPPAPRRRVTAPLGAAGQGRGVRVPAAPAARLRAAVAPIPEDLPLNPGLAEKGQVSPERAGVLGWREGEGEERAGPPPDAGALPCPARLSRSSAFTSGTPPPPTRPEMLMSLRDAQGSPGTSPVTQTADQWRPVCFCVCVARCNPGCPVRCEFQAGSERCILRMGLPVQYLM